MPQSLKESTDVIGVSKSVQVDAETAQTVDVAFLLDAGSQININDYREHNQAEKTGFEEPTKIDAEQESDADGSFNMAKSQPDFLTFLFKFLFGNYARVTAGSTGFLGTMNMAEKDTPDYFTALHRMGNIARFDRHVGLAVNTVDLAMAKDAYMSANGGIIGIGKRNSQSFSETISATGDETSLVISKQVQGEEKLNVTVIADKNDDGTPDTPVTVTAIVNATKTLTITSLDAGAGNINYHVTYIVLNSESGYTQFNVGSLASNEEFKIRTKNLKINVGGRYDGSAIVDGMDMDCGLESINYNCTRNAAVSKCFRGGSLPVDFATGIENGLPLQTLTLNRQAKDFFLKYNYDKNYKISLHVEAVGPEFESGQRYMFEMIFPFVGIIEKKMEVSNERWIDAGNLVVLKDTANSWPSAIVKTRCQVDYA